MMFIFEAKKFRTWIFHAGGRSVQCPSPPHSIVLPLPHSAFTHPGQLPTSCTPTVAMQSQCCMQIGRANCIVVQPASQVSSEFGNTVRTRRAVGPRSSVCSLLHWRVLCWILHPRTRVSEGCVSLSGGAEHRLKAAGPCYMLCSCLLPAAKVVNTNVAAGNLVAVCSAKSAQRRPAGWFVTYAVDPASSQKPSGSQARHWRHFPWLHTNSNDGLRMTQKCLPRTINPPKSSLWPVISQPLLFFLPCMQCLFIPKNFGMTHSSMLVLHHHILDQLIGKGWAAAAGDIIGGGSHALQQSAFSSPALGVPPHK